MSLWGRRHHDHLSGRPTGHTDLYEAAEIDGANSWRKLLNITVPLMTPVVFFNLVMSVINTFQVFTCL